MLVIRLLKLVLDEHPSAIRRIVGNDVSAVRPHFDFAALKVQVQADYFGEAAQVLGEPGCEVLCFMCPGTSQIGCHEFSQLG